jgi:hypothetical protein
VHAQAFQTLAGQLRWTTMIRFLHRRKLDRLEPHAGQPDIHQQSRDTDVVEPRRTDGLERVIGAPPFRDVHTLEQAGPDIREQ